ncbi:unnamed protein product [Clonostachys rosea]|uniref:Zn(2)-C6 fungal-type domain-containing protein n=1 Tax=Bionectria ochroleuca TaxID=29856 RepID=A0ABY6UK93_BIOOC|nr:unnamed protein product [Clonostachys rosea]
MPLRRRSCEACFKSRRKCDYGYPSCGTCQRTRKNCRYANAPISPSSPNSAPVLSKRPSPLNATTSQPMTSNTSWLDVIDMIEDNNAGTSLEITDLSEFTSEQLPNGGTTPSPSWTFLPAANQQSIRLLGPLGEVQPMEGSTESWQWVLDQLKSYPREFAEQSQTLFIHPDLYRDSMPTSIRAAFGASSASCLLNQSNRTMLFQIIDTEVVQLLQDYQTNLTLLDELARLQALALYQTIRIFHGGVEQRMLAEQQQTVLMGSALKLLTRSQAELKDAEAVCWTSWILAECIRRTAFVVYMLYGVHSIVQQGICIGFHTLVALPTSTALNAWNSEADHHSQLEPAKTVTYEMFTEGWPAMPHKLLPLEKFLLVPCKGINVIEAYEITEDSIF